MEGYNNSKSHITTVCHGGGRAKLNYFVETTVSLQPMSRMYPDLTLRRKIKRKDHKDDDVLDVPSLGEDEFYAEPPVERPTKDVCPYETEIDTASPVSMDVRSVSNDTTSNATQKWASEKAESKIGTSCTSSSKRVDDNNNNNNTQVTPKVANWDLMQGWDRFPSSSPCTSKSSKTRTTERTTKLRPSPLAKCLGTVLENVGHVSADFFIHLCHLTSKGISYQGPIGVLLIMACVYYSIIYLEVSLANSAEIVLEWLWPLIHVCLRGVERFLRSATNFVESLDELGESLVCDWAQIWCAQFELMCHQRCSFTSKTLDRFRH